MPTIDEQIAEECPLLNETPIECALRASKALALSGPARLGVEFDTLAEDLLCDLTKTLDETRALRTVAQAVVDQGKLSENGDGGTFVEVPLPVMARLIRELGKAAKRAAGAALPSAGAPVDPPVWEPSVDPIRRHFEAAKSALFAAEEMLGAVGTHWRQRVYSLRAKVAEVGFDVEVLRDVERRNEADAARRSGKGGG